MTKLRHAAIRERLQRCVDMGLLASFSSGGDWPGMRWIIEGGPKAFFSTRVYTTNEVEIFLTGALATYYALKVD